MNLLRVSCRTCLRVTLPLALVVMPHPGGAPMHESMHARHCWVLRCAECVMVVGEGGQTVKRCFEYCCTVVWSLCSHFVVCRMVWTYVLRLARVVVLFPVSSPARAHVRAVPCVESLFRGIGMATYNLSVAGLLVAAVAWADADAQV